MTDLNLSPEGAAIAQAVAKKTGMASNSIAPNIRMREERVTVAISPKAAPKEPTRILDIDDNGCLRPTGEDDLLNLRMGLHEHRRNGLVEKWAIVFRRNGDKVCQLEYDSELTCMYEFAMIHQEIQRWVLGDPPFIVNTNTIKLTNYNPTTGQVI
jgi:hypothetical protein